MRSREHALECGEDGPRYREHVSAAPPDCIDYQQYILVNEAYGRLLRHGADEPDIRCRHNELLLPSKA